MNPFNQSTQKLTKSDTELPVLDQLPKQNPAACLPTSYSHALQHFSPDQIPASAWLSGSLVVFMGGEGSILFSKLIQQVNCPSMLQLSASLAHNLIAK